MTLPAAPGTYGQTNEAQTRALIDAKLKQLDAAISGLAAYKSGAWTPTILGSGAAGSPTYTVKVGSYEKVGRQVTARFYVAWSGISGLSGNLQVGGLPFASTVTTNDFGAGILFNTTGITLTSGYSWLGLQIVPSAPSVAALVQNGSGAASANLAMSGVASTGNLLGALFYRVDGS